MTFERLNGTEAQRPLKHGGDTARLLNRAMANTHEFQSATMRNLSNLGIAIPTVVAANATYDMMHSPQVSRAVAETALSVQEAANAAILEPIKSVLGDNFPSLLNKITGFLSGIGNSMGNFTEMAGDFAMKVGTTLTEYLGDFVMPAGLNQLIASGLLAYRLIQKKLASSPPSEESHTDLGALGLAV